MKLSVIIVNYNVSHFLEQTLLSVRKAAEGLDLEIIVVDNNSIDGSVEMLRRRFPHIQLIENKVNLGFSKANNQGIKLASGEYILLLNPDTVLEEDTLRKCCAFMDLHDDAGALGVMMVDGNGDYLPESKRGFPSPWVAFTKVFGLAALFPKSEQFGKYHLGYLDNHKTHEVDVLSGAYMFVRKNVFDKIGLLDEEFFMYGEDIDLSYRIKKGGYKNYYFPGTRIIHYKGESTKKTSLNYVFIFYKAMNIFAAKHLSNNGAFAFSVLINLAIYLRAGLSLFVQFLKSALLPAIDVGVLYLGMFLLKNYWEGNYKSANYYPAEFMSLAVPFYIVTWLLALYFSGGYDKFFRTSQIVRGILVGTILISAVSNFIEEVRFSKALIIIGAVWAIFLLSLVRLLKHFYLYKNFNLGEIRKKRVIVIGSSEESRRAIDLLRSGSSVHEILGYVSPQTNGSTDTEMYLGTINHLKEILAIYGVEEIIFCSKDFSINQIIEWMMGIEKQLIEYKILPDDSNYIIGSNSKNTKGEFYTLNLDLNILQRSAVRNKRVFDLGLSVILLLLSPIIIWVIKNRSRFFINILNVINGKCTWVGFSNSLTVSLPKLKRGIISPVSHMSDHLLDQPTINRLNLLYAKNYSTYLDLMFVVKSFKNLGL